MENIQKIIYLNLLWLLLVLSGCKSLKDPILPELSKVPTAFDSENDSINTSVLSPQNLFNDSNLISLLDSALTKNLALLRNKTTLQQLEADILEARSNLLPTIGAFAGYSNRRFGLHTMDGAGNITTPIGDGEIIPIRLNDFNFGLQTSWEIDVWGKLKQQKNATISRYLAAKESQNLLKTAIVEQAVFNYFNLVYLDESKRIIQQNISLNDELLIVLKAQKEAAKTTQLSVQQFEALNLNYANDLLEIEQAIYFAESELRSIIGEFEGEIKRSDFAGSKLIELEIQAGIPAQLLSNRPDIRQAEQTLLATNADLMVARKMFYPSISINGSIGYQAYKTRFLFSSPESIAYGLFGNLMAPIINMGALKANFKKASASQLDAYYGYQESILNAFTEINNVLFAIKTTKKMLTNKQQEMLKLKDARVISRELFSATRADYLEVLFAQQNALLAEMDYLELQKNQFIYKVYLYKAIGGGWR